MDPEYRASLEWIREWNRMCVRRAQARGRTKHDVGRTETRRYLRAKGRTLDYLLEPEEVREIRKRAQ